LHSFYPPYLKHNYILIKKSSQEAGIPKKQSTRWDVVSSKLVLTNQYMIIRKYAKIYKKASKKQKTKILDLLTGMLSISRNYIAYLLCNTGKIVSIPYR